MKLQKNTQIGAIQKSISGNQLCWNGYAWEKPTNTTPVDAVFTRKISQEVIREIPDGNINDINYIFALQCTVLANSEQVYLNGVLQKRGDGKDYIMVGNRIYIVEPPQYGSILTCSYATASSTEIRGDIPQGLVDAVNAVYVLQQTPIAGTEHVFLNGILQQPGLNQDYNIQENILVFTEAPMTGSLIVCDYSHT